MNSVIRIFAENKLTTQF